MKKEKKLVSAEKTVYMAGYLRSVSWHTLKEAEENERGRYFNCMASIVFSAFSIEAYLNHLGERKIAFWSTIERNLSPSKKLEVISVQLELSIDYGSRPFQSFKPIFKFRDFLAHGRTEYLMEENVQLLTDFDDPELPQSQWQEHVSLETAQRYLDDTRKMIEYIHEASGLEINPLLVPETAGWHITLIDKE